MRTFSFKARNIGEEKYLTYTMGEECELDEDVLDYCEDNEVAELLDIIYEEDDDYDYLTYDISGKTSLEEFIGATMKVNQVLSILRNVASEMISIKEQTISLSYILLNRNYIYVDPSSCKLKFICLPIESKGSLAVEFKGFVRQLLANMKYDVDEELGYVGKLLTYINSDAFNLRGLVGLSEALMEEAGVEFESENSIDADGVEVVSEEPEVAKENVTDFMSQAEDVNEVFPEIGDDEDEEDEEEEDVAVEDEELESILPAGMSVPSEDKETEEEESQEEEPEEIEEAAETESEAEEAEAVSEPEKVEEVKVEKKVSNLPPSVETDVDIIKNRIKELAGEVPKAKIRPDSGDSFKTIDELDEFLESKPPVIKKNVVKVNRAALIQSAAEHESVTEELSSDEAVLETVDRGSASSSESVPVIEDIYDDMNSEKDESKPKSSYSALTKTVADIAKSVVSTAPPKANPYIIRVNTEERIMINKATFKLGKASRGVDYSIGGNGAISRQHAVILQKDGVCYIKDNKSTNHTYVNGKMVEEGVEEILTHDSMIKLGDEEFVFKIR